MTATPTPLHRAGVRARWQRAAIRVLALLAALLVLSPVAAGPAAALDTPAAAMARADPKDCSLTNLKACAGDVGDCLANLYECAQDKAGDVVDGIEGIPGKTAELVLKPIADGIAALTNEMVRVIVVEWLYQSSMRLDKTGVFVEPAPGKPKVDGMYGGGPGCTKKTDPGKGGSGDNDQGGSGDDDQGGPGNADQLAAPLAAGDPALAAGDPGAVVADPSKEAPCNTASKAMTQLASAKVQAVMAGVGAIIAVILLLFQAIRTAWQRKGAHLQQAFQGLFVMAVMSATGIAILNGMLIGSDALTAEILDSSLGKGLGQRVTFLLGLSTVVFGPIPVILFGVIIFLIGLVQLVLLFFRQAAIPVLALLIPVAAAGQIGGKVTQEWQIRLWSTLMALAAYKPFAAMIFAVGFLEVGEGQGIWDIVRGLCTLALAIIALPMLMKTFQPVVGMAVGDGWQDGFGKLVGAARDAIDTASALAGMGGNVKNPADYATDDSGGGETDAEVGGDDGGEEEVTPKLLQPGEVPGNPAGGEDATGEDGGDDSEEGGDGLPTDVLPDVGGDGKPGGKEGGDGTGAPVTGDPATDATIQGAEMVSDKVEETSSKVTDTFDDSVDAGAAAFAGQDAPGPQPSESGAASEPSAERGTTALADPPQGDGPENA